MKKKVDKVSIAVLVIFSLYYIWYCNSTMIELPYLTWFAQIPLADKYFSGKIQLIDLFSKYGEHGMLANNILYLFNVIFFHGTTLFDVYINDIIVIICGTIVIWCTLQTLGMRKDRIIWIVAEGVFLMSNMQGSSGAMETQVRFGILFFLIAMLFVDKELRDCDVVPRRLAATTLLIILSINVFGTMYSFAGVPLIWAIVVLYIIKDRRCSKKNIYIAGLYVILIPLYVMEYRLLDNSGMIEPTKLGGIFDVFIHPLRILKGLFAWYANGVLGWAYHESSDYNSTFFLLIGAIVFVLTIIAVILFFRSRMYELTWLPLMLIVYSLGVFFEVYLGRETDWRWFAGEWYNVHIKLGIVAIIWVYGYLLGYYRERITGWKYMLTVVYIPMIFLLVTGIAGNMYGLKRAPSVRAFYAEKQKYLYINDAEKMPVGDDGNTPLCDLKNITMDAISILKKYNLSIYQYWDAYEACPTTPPGDAVKYLEGRYDDGWVEDNVIFVLNTKDASELQVQYMALERQHITIWVDDIRQNEVILEKGNGNFAINCNRNQQITIRLKSDYIASLTPPDVRQASYRILGIERIK